MTITIQSPPWRVGVDVGGTFTDLVIADSEGRTEVFKVPSVPADPGEGVINALDAACVALDQTTKKFLGDCQFFLHGSTVATNTLLEGKGAKVGLLTTRGFRDSLEARRGLRKDPWDHRTPYPPVLVPRYLRQPVGGRINSKGEEIEPINFGDVREACRIFRDEGVESIAVCLLNSFANSSHENAVVDLLREESGCDWISVSSDIVPIMGEYERTSTTAVNAYVMPRVASYLTALQKKLIDMGLQAKLLMLQSNGGAASLDQLIRQPVNLLLSGPSAGVGAMHHLADGIGENNLVSMEIGGTSCDVMLMHEGRVAITDSLSVNEYDLVTPSVDIHTVGAGGGTISGLDSAGLMYAGPEGAGARPGPAAYGHGGTRPTVTDAHLVLGRMRPGPYAGGSVSLNMSLAEKALDTEIADPAGISRIDAAAGLIRIVEQNLLHAVERISIQRGYNPGRFMLIACGGAGPMHGASVGRKLGARAVYVPRQAGAFCAIGMQHANVRRDFVHVVMQELNNEVTDAISKGYKRLETQALEALNKEGFEKQDTEFDYELDLHYEGQQWDVRVVLDPDATPEDIRVAFEVEYDRQFGHTNPDSRINIAKLRVVGIGKLPALEDLKFDPVYEAAIPIETRPVYSESAGEFLDTPIYRGADLYHGHSFFGPAIIEEATTTILVGPGDSVKVDQLNNYLVTFETDG
ncbi:MAG: Acetophenone carboxylase gamma subunit [Alphaproteobacteria bacterium MarineAlpha11_Bin1]|nr:MAG: Acetophenone carboxylase gamma subunit [Alphaproteobacteria bacterium MarineAlpha11_Bin1]|tara:strand:- start:17878 stop:19953 length:2076 start_codon:yes stop_codon:yes gene_type:complete